MPRPTPLPTELPFAFTVADARRFGVSRGQLSRLSLSAPFHGVRLQSPPRAASLLVERAIEYAPRLRPWQFFSHETALALVGAPLPEWPHRPSLHVAAHRPAREPRTRGIVGHRLQLREPAIIETREGLRIEHPVRAWRQTGSLWALDDLVAAGDYLVSGAEPIATLSELRREVFTMGDMRGGILSRSLADIRIGPRSPRETKLRLLLVRAGLPEPELSWTLRDSLGRFVAELDLAYVRWHVAPEYDGRVHADDPVQFARDGDRWDRIRAQGWDHVRIMKHHMRGDGQAAVRKVRDALIRGGWRPGA